MTSQQIADLQKHVGAKPDGFWGPKSTAACQRHLRALMPTANPWPASDEASLRKFYGEPGDTHLVSIPVGALPVAYMGRPVKTIRCHERAAESLSRALAAIAAGANRGILSTYAGSFNLRRMRGGTSLSTHSWGIAIDFDPDRNGNRVHWPTQAKMPIGIMEEFAREGWLSAGAFWSRDAMHFQATR
jgi:hypothetical protein